MEGSSATITAVAAGDAVITVSASDGSASVSQGFRVEVAEGPDAATVVISRLLDANRQQISDPTGISGTIYVVLDVESNDETWTNIGLTLNGDAVTPMCRGSASADVAVGPGLAAAGQAEIECALNTNAVVGECVGMQLMPKYANGPYALGAFLTTDADDRRDVIAPQPIRLNNHGFVMLSHSYSEGSTSDVVGGVTFYGGPAGENDGNTHSFHACPVSYSGTTVGEISLHAMVTGPDASALDDAPPAIAFLTTSSGAPRNGVARTDKEAPFTWTVNPAINWNVENTAGANEHWLVNSGDIKDDGGLLVIDEFRGGEEAKLGPRYFDFKAPTFDRDDGDRGISLHLGGTTVVPVENKYYSAGNFRVNGLADGGVGGASATIAVGDCSVAANSDGDRRTVFAAADGLAAVSGIGDLPEDDITDDFNDDDGLNCYLAEVTGIRDGFMNAASPRSGNSTIQTASHFGVDKGDPELSDFEPDETGLVLGAGKMLSFDVEDPELATSEPGSGISEVRWWIGTRGYTHSTTTVKGTATITNGAVSIDTDLTGPASTTGEGSRTVNVQVRDGAVPVNTASTSFSFIRDTKSPTFALSRSQGDISPQTATSVAVSVGGTITDANVIRTAELTLRVKGTDQACVDAPLLSDGSMPNTPRRVGRNKIDLENDTNSITFEEAFTIQAPSGPGSGPENYCFYLDSEDIAVESNGRADGNEGDLVLSEFMVSWPSEAETPVYEIVVPADPVSGTEGTTGEAGGC